MQQTDRLGWIEHARIWAALGVVLLHVCTSICLTCDLEGERVFAYAVLGVIFGRWAVPAFFMLTGYLLLDSAKAVDGRRVRRYALRMVYVLATFGFMFSLMEETWTSLREGAQLGAHTLVCAVLDVLTASSWDHLWYVYALIVVYLFVPALRALYARLGKKGFATFSLALSGVVLVVPTVLRTFHIYAGREVVIEQSGLVALAMNSAVGVACCCLGGCLRNWRMNALACAGGLLSLVAMLVVAYLDTYVSDFDLSFALLQGSCFACLYAMMVLMLFRKRWGSAPLDADSIVGRLARDSFGIYILHPLFVHAALILLDPMAFPPVLFEVALYAAVVVASVAATELVRKIPYIGTLLS